MKTIKTREKVRGIKVLDKSVSASKRMKDSFIRTKQQEAETQESEYSSPTEYASGTVQNRFEDVRHLPNPTQKAQKNLRRTKGHFEEVRQQAPTERKRAAEQAQHKAQQAKANATTLRKTADKADETAQTAKSAVTDAKQELKRVRYEGRRTVQQAKQQAAAKAQSAVAAKTQAAAPSKPPDISAKVNPSAPSYMNKGVTASKGAVTPTKAAKPTEKNIKQAAKSTVKTAKKSVKTAEQTAKKAVKTAQQSAKVAQKSAQAAAKTAKVAERAARTAAKTAAKAAKASAKAVTAMVKATIAALKGLVTAIAAGGWIAIVAVLLICMIGLLLASPFGIFFSSEPSKSGMTINSVMREINTEYSAEIDSIIADNPHDLLDMSGAKAAWKEVLVIYAVKTCTDLDNPMEVATVDSERAALLRSIFWEMNTIKYTADSISAKQDILGDDGLPTGETTTVTTTVLRIVLSHKTADEMVKQFNFSNEQRAKLEELRLPDYHYLWNALLYGITSIGDGSIISVAESQIGNIGGEPYWSWYGWSSRVAWCACFVSWCAEQCGYIDAGIIPMFAYCPFGVKWFKDNDQWQDRSYTPRTGDIIFFDWENDGVTDHVGIVESVENGYVNTIEGNTSDSVARRSYTLGNVKIYGYGVPVY
ncbi:CHAP domain-containing protein [Clostridiaceae bacterium OttesenSCG-928-D20]|nr:CHAP domain-containing protein [Clostridiaceae bacterium OttesenSCG-928-D20]